MASLRPGDRGPLTRLTPSQHQPHPLGDSALLTSCQAMLLMPPPQALVPEGAELWSQSVVPRIRSISCELIRNAGSSAPPQTETPRDVPGKLRLRIPRTHWSCIARVRPSAVGSWHPRRWGSREVSSGLGSALALLRRSAAGPPVSELQSPQRGDGGAVPSLCQCS